METKKAFGYLRVSGRGQLDGDGFARQRKAIEEFAAAQNINIVQWFEEKGVTGTVEDRPAWRALLTELHSDGVAIVIVEKLDRVARDLMVQESIIASLMKDGFELRSASEPDMCSADPSRVLIRQILGAFNQYERSTIVLKLRAARDRKRRNGRCEGRKPYGFRPGEQEIRDRMANMHGEGASWTAIANTLNSEGIKTRSGGKWFPASVSQIFNANHPF